MAKVKFEEITDGKHALEKSIEVWKEIIRIGAKQKFDAVYDGYMHDCPLCELYQRESFVCCEKNGVYCPFDVDYGKSMGNCGCESSKSPYMKWFRSKKRRHAKKVLKYLQKELENYEQR